MAASKAADDKSRKREQIRRYAPPDTRIPARLGGGILKEYVAVEIVTQKLHRYALAYIIPAIFNGDNGRVLGYVNAHGQPHRHYMGHISPEPALTWDQIREKFEQEWRAIAMNLVNGG